MQSRVEAYFHLFPDFVTMMKNAREFKLCL